MELREALGIIDDTTRPFSIEFASYDATRSKESEMIKLPLCVKTGASHNRRKHDTVVIKPVDREGHPYVVHNYLITRVNGSRIFI